MPNAPNAPLAPVLAVLLAGALLAGCSSSSFYGWRDDTLASSGVYSAPFPPVQRGVWAPVTQPTLQGIKTPNAPSIDGEGQGEQPRIGSFGQPLVTDDQAALQQGADGQTPFISEPLDKTPVTRQAMVGAWTVSTPTANCQIFLALTKWAGGYRAASRGCIEPVMADVQAWNVQNDIVILVGSSGTQSANLYRTGPQRFDGTTLNGTTVTFSR